MTERPEALRLAEYMDAPLNDPRDVADAAAAELRRLHALVMDKQGEIYGLNFARETERKTLNLVKAERDALRALLLRLHAWDMMDATADGPFWKQQIDAMLKAREAK